MPELTFVTRWPDGQVHEHYSPSLVVHDHLTAGRSYEVADFVARAGTALQLASDRVKARYGVACTSAAESMAAIHAIAATCPSGPVTVESLTPERLRP